MSVYCKLLRSTTKPNAPVAQLDRASGYEPEGREFESLRAHHFMGASSDNINESPFFATSLLPLDGLTSNSRCSNIPIKLRQWPVLKFHIPQSTLPRRE